MKSFTRKDGGDQKKVEGAKDEDSGNPTINFHGKQRSNQTHQSTTDPQVVLYRKAKGRESKLCFGVQALMENRHGLCAQLDVHNPVAQGEPDMALAQVDQHTSVLRNFTETPRPSETSDWVVTVLSGPEKMLKWEA